MATLTTQQAADVQAMMDNVQKAYVATNASRAALGKLIDVGAATCKDVQTYNLTVKSVYAYQAVVAGIIKANGGQAPSVPAPVYVAWKGVAGDQAANIDCGAAQLNGWAPSGLGDYRVNPLQVEWRQEVLPSDQALVNRIVNSVTPGGRLGDPVTAAAIIYVILVGIAIAVAGYIVLRIVEALTDIPGKVETTKQVGLQAEQNQKALELRASCYTDCTSKGTSPTDCAKACDRLYPAWVPKLPAGSLGIIGTIAGVAVLGLALFATYRFVSSRPRGGHGHGRGHQHALPAGIDEDDVIDVEAA